MNIFLTVLFILLAVVVVIFFSLLITKLKLKIAIEKKSGEKPTALITVETLGGLIKKNLSDIKKPKPGKKNIKSSGSNDSGLRKKINTYYKNFKKIKFIFLNSKHKARKKILIEKFRLNIDFGLDDAAHTGIATGSLWAGIYNVIAFLSHISLISEPEICVNADYENEKLAFDGECIIILRLANIISILYVIGINYFTLKNKEKAAINYGNTN